MKQKIFYGWWIAFLTVGLLTIAGGFIILLARPQRATAEA